MKLIKILLLKNDQIGTTIPLESILECIERCFSLSSSLLSSFTIFGSFNRDFSIGVQKIDFFKFVSCLLYKLIFHLSNYKDSNLNPDFDNFI